MNSSLLKIAGPVVFTYVGIILMQVVDTMVVGRVSASALAGVALGNACFYTAMVAGFGLISGMDFLISHAFGSGNIKSCRQIFLQTLTLSSALSIPLGLIPFLLSWRLEWFGSTPEVIDQSINYLRILASTMPTVMVFTACRQYMAAVNEVKAPVVILIAANIVNLVANLALVLGYFGAPAMGTTGSAIATGIARLFMMLMILAYIFGRDRELRAMVMGGGLRPHWGTILRMLKLGVPAAAQMILEVAAFSGSTALASRLGAVATASHQIVLQIASFTFMVPLGISAATGVMVGAKLGSGDPQEAGRMGWRGLGLGVGFMTFSGLTLFLAARPILGMFTNDEAVITASTSLILLAALFQIADGIQVVTTGALRGVADTRTSMFANLGGHWFVGIPMGIYLCFYAGHGLTGIWQGLSLGLVIVASVLLIMWYREARGLLSGALPDRVIRLKQ